MSRWFRFHADALNNPKVQRLDGETFKAWVNLLCLACQADGCLPTAGDIAFALRISEEAADELVDRLVSMRLLDESQESGLRPHGWDEHQYVSDSSKVRTKRYRDRHRDGDVTSQERHKPVTVTAPEQIQNRTEQNRAEQNSSLFSVLDFFEERYAEHPKKGHRSSAEMRMSEISDITSEEFRENFRKVHRAMIASDDWKWKNGVKAPYFDEWIVDKGYNYPPAEQVQQPTAAVDPVIAAVLKRREEMARDGIR